MNPNATWTRPDPVAETDEQFVAKYLSRLGMKAVAESAVVLDLDDATRFAGSMGIVARLRKVVETGETHGLACTRDIIASFADQIEAQTRPPKPPEPTGLGAVVEDAEGRRWTQVGVRCWIGDGRGLTGFGWGEIDAVRVLSEGVPQ